MNASNSPSLRLHNVSFAYTKKTPILLGVNLEINSGEVVAITGTSGAGKSTLLSVIMGLLKPNSGEVAVAGKRVRTGMGKSSAKMRREIIGMVFQSGYLLDELTPVENIILPALIAGCPLNKAREKARSLLDTLQLEVTQRPTASLSGGEQQRVAIARALINSPKLLIADEPTASLDDANKAVVLDSLWQHVHNQARGLLLVTHDEQVARCADRHYRLSDGHLTEGN